MVLFLAPKNVLKIIILIIIIKLMFTSLCLPLISSSFRCPTNKLSSILDYKFINNAMSLTQIKILSAHYHTCGQYKIQSIIMHLGMSSS